MKSTAGGFGSLCSTLVSILLFLPIGAFAAGSIVKDPTCGRAMNARPFY